MDKELFLRALGLSSPWFIKEVTLDLEKERLDIFLDFTPGSRFQNDDGDMVTAEQTVEKTWKHLFFWQYPTYLHARVPKLKDKEGRVHIIDIPWAREGSGFTLLFESLVLELAQHIPLSRLARNLKENDERLMRIVTYYVDKSRALADYSSITRGGIDETSRKKGHNYITTFINLDTARVVSIALGKGKEAVEELARDIEQHSGKRGSIREISTDFSPAFTSGIYASFPQAEIVYDRFHFMQFIGKAVDETRRLETKNNTFLKGSRYLWLTNPTNLSEQKREKLEDLKTKNKALYTAYQMKENVRDFFECKTRVEAEEFLESWCTWVMESQIEPMKSVIKTIRMHWHGILNYAERRISSGVVEGLNSVIQTIKRRARGYRNTNHFMTMIYLKLGDFAICQAT